MKAFCTYSNTSSSSFFLVQEQRMASSTENLQIQNWDGLSHTHLAGLNHVHRVMQKQDNVGFFRCTLGQLCQGLLARVLRFLVVLCHLIWSVLLAPLMPISAVLCQQILSVQEELKQKDLKQKVPPPFLKKVLQRAQVLIDEFRLRKKCVLLYVTTSPILTILIMTKAGKENMINYDFDYDEY